MNRGHVLQSSPVQQMAAAGNPNWWSMMRPPPPLQHQPSPSPFLPHPSNLFPHQYAPSFAPPSSSPLPNNYFLYDNNDQDLHRHESLSQLLLGGLVEEEVDHHHHKNGMVDFDEVLRHQQASHNNNVIGHVKQETSSSSYNNMYGHGHHANQHEEDDDASAAATTKPAWSPANMLHVPNFPKPCLSNVSTNMLDFSTKNDVSLPRPDRSSESNSSTGSGGAPKKARVQHSSTQSSSTTTIKVRKEKLGDRITNLHQLVSPFGKTDTASVLLEAIGYIRFLQNQIEALSLPYLGSGSGNNNVRQLHQQQSVQGDRNCLFPEDPGQLLNDNCLKRKGAPHDQTCNEEPQSDLRSKGLCLVPVSCMLQVGSDNGADYWAPALGAGAGFR